MTDLRFRFGEGRSGPAAPRRPGSDASAEPGLGRAAPAAAKVLAFLATFSFAFILPVLMVVANKSAPATLGAAALLANLAVLLAGRGDRLRARYLRLLRGGTAQVIGAVVALLAVSFAWSIAPQLTFRGLLEGLPELVFALGMAAAWPIFARPDDVVWLGLGLVGAMLLIAFEHLAGMPLHALVHARGEAWDLKRSAIPPAFLLWPAVEYCCARKLRLVAVGLFASAAIGVVFAHSGAPGLGLMTAAAVFFAGRHAPRMTRQVCGLVLGILIVTAPWTGSIAGRTLPAPVENALSEEHAAHRIRIWRAFETRVHDRPWLGHGFDTSFKVSTAPRPGGLPLPEDNDTMVDNHPHDIALQIWVELGVLGALAAAASSLFVLRRLGRMAPQPMSVRLALLVSVIAVGLVGLSAWQPWWLATIAATLIWFDVTAEGAAERAG